MNIAILWCLTSLQGEYLCQVQGTNEIDHLRVPHFEFKYRLCDDQRDEFTCGKLLPGCKVRLGPALMLLGKSCAEIEEALKPKKEERR